jgi:hypothetical protein
MKIAPSLLIVMALMFVSVQTRAATLSADYLFQVCSSDEEGQETVENGHVTCQAYIAGLMDYQKMLQSMNVAPPAVAFCIPESVDMNTIQNQVYRYLKNNAEQQGPFIAAPGVAIALKTYYPCKKK